MKSLDEFAAQKLDDLAQLFDGLLLGEVVLFHARGAQDGIAEEAQERDDGCERELEGVERNQAVGQDPLAMTAG